ncbi:MAG: hypothetical protein IKO27_09015 [Ruminococcus sp.]|nr:hypothetical protein [Ruminococcus sp.]
MKKLLKHISPLAPDDSGACSVLYELGGITVICDAGGCAGNVCGFDEPRWFEKRSALFSAGLRDMDAILGRDELLVKKLAKITEQIGAEFTAIVGTPVPAVIATDMKALERMSEKKTGLPCMAFRTDGTRLYDYGEELVYTRLFDQFAVGELPVKKGRLGVIGATPLNTGETCSRRIADKLLAEGWDEVVCFGMDSGLDDIRNAGECERLLVIAPSGLRAARLMQERFGTPFDVRYPLAEVPEDISGVKVLVIHQQTAANSIREILETRGCEVVCASWFGMYDSLKREGDVRIKGEDDLQALAAEGGFDVILADEFFRRAVPDFAGRWYDLPHFAVSGRLCRGTADR